MRTLNRMMIWSCLLLGLCLCMAANAGDLKAIRYADHGNFFRFVLDLSEIPKYRLMVLENESTVRLDLRDTRIRCNRSQQITHVNSPVEKISIRTGSGLEAIDFHLSETNAKPKYFTLKNPNRLVVDFYRVTPERPLDLSRRNFKVVVIDPGHGGWDAGAQGYGLQEKDICLDIAKRLQKYFQASDSFQAYLTRTGDYLPFLDKGDVPDPRDKNQRLGLRRKSLSGRIDFANQPFDVGGDEYYADLFISIHVNSFIRNRSVKGFEVWIPGDKIAQDEMSRELQIVENAVDGDKVLDIKLNDTNRDAAKVILSMVGEQMGNLNPLLASHIEQQMKKADRDYQSRGIKEGPFRVLRQMRMPALLVEVGFISNRTEVKQFLSEDWFQQYIAYALYTGINNYFQEVEGFRPDVVKAPTKPVRPQYLVYQVRKGDCLSKLEQQYGVSYRTIKRVNGLKSDILRPGQKLKIPKVY